MRTTTRRPRTAPRHQPAATGPAPRRRGGARPDVAPVGPTIEDACTEALVAMMLDGRGRRRTALEVLLISGAVTINRMPQLGGAPSPGLGTEPIVGQRRVLLVGDGDPDSESLRRAALHAAAMLLAHAAIRDMGEAAEVADCAAARAELRTGLPARSRPGEAQRWDALDDFAGAVAA